MKPNGNNKETPQYDIITIGGAEYKVKYTRLKSCASGC